MVGFGADSHMGQFMRQNLDGIGHPEPGIHGNEDSPVIPKFCEAISLFTVIVRRDLREQFCAALFAWIQVLERLPD